VPYSPLGRGFLTGALTRAEDLPEGDFRRNQPRLQGENYDRNMALVERLRGLATRVHASPAQIALAWLLGQGPDVVPIFGTTRRARLRENLAAASLQLAACDQFLVDQTFAPDTVSGARYNEAGLALLDRG
jgi:aryl-alcohol dehydrogenase-like predicted oxidoreductase